MKATQAQNARHLGLAMTVLSGAYSAGIWLSDYALMQDLPGHIEVAFLIRQLVEGDPLYTEAFKLRSLPWPNALSHLLIAALGKLVGEVIAAKLLATSAIVAWNLSLVVVGRQLKAPLWGLLLASLSSLDLAWGYGFLGFLLAKPCVLLSWHWLTRDKAPARAWVLALAQAPLFLLHGFAWALCWLGFALFMLRGSQRWRTLLPAAFTALPLSWNYLDTLYFGATEPHPMRATYRWLDWQAVLPTLWRDLTEVYGGSVDSLVYLAALLIYIALYARRRTRQHTLNTREVAWGTVALGLAAAALILPYDTPNVAVIAPRSLSFAFALGALLLSAHCARSPLKSGVDRALRLASLALCLAHGTAHAWSTHHFARTEMLRFDALLARLPARAKVAVMYRLHRGRGGARFNLRYWPRLGALRHDLRFNDSFAYLPTTFVVLRDKTQRNKLSLYGRASCQNLKTWDFLLLQKRQAELPQRLEACFTFKESVERWHLFEHRPAKAPPYADWSRP